MCGVIVASLFVSPLTHSKNGQCRRIISELYRFVDLATDVDRMGDDMQSIFPAVGDGRSQDTLSVRLKIVFRRQLHQLGIPESTADSMFVDPWMRPLNVEWRSSLAGRSVSVKLMAIRSDILIWSSGPDGRNDYGLGDDVVCLAPLVMKTAWVGPKEADGESTEK